MGTGGGDDGGGCGDTLISTSSSDINSSNSHPTTASTFTINSSSSSSDGTSSSPYPRLLEIILISAQDLPQISKSMRTYAVAWIQPKRKLTSTVDQKGHTNPTWNERFAFFVTDELIASEDAALSIEIYNLSWFKDALIGTVQVLMSDLMITTDNNTPRFVALQIRHPSGKFQGKLNMGVSFVDHDDDDHDCIWTVDQNHEKEHTTTWGFESPEKGDPSVINGSELYSDIGPSASIVAAEIARKSFPVPSPPQIRPAPPPVKEISVENVGSRSSIVEEMTVEEATAKGLMTSSKVATTAARRRKMYEGDKSRGVHMRRHSDGGLFSCFGNAYGFEFKIVCGSTHNKPNFKEQQISTPVKNSRPN